MPSSYPLPEDLTQLAPPQDLATARAMVSSLVARVQQAEARTHELEAQLKQAEARAQQAEAQALAFAHAVQQRKQERERLQAALSRLEAEYEALCYRRFGPRERFVHPDQGLLPFADQPELLDDLRRAAQQAKEYVESQTPQRRRRRRGQGRRERFWKNLEHRDMPVAPRPEDRHCPEHGERTCIGYDVHYKLQMQAARFWIEVWRFPKFVCPGCAACGVHSPPAPPALVRGDRYGASVLADVVVSKFGLHLPYYRQQDMYASVGWLPSRSTLENLASIAANWLRPVARCCLELLLADGVIGCDDTPCRVIVPETLPKLEPTNQRSVRMHEVFAAARRDGKKSVLARMWVYHSFVQRLVAYDFTVSRHRDGPAEVLASYRGLLMGDCWAGFESIAVGAAGRIARGACWSHGRRHVYQAEETDTLHARRLLGWIQVLYELEDVAREWSATQRWELRQRYAVPLLEKMGASIHGPEVAAVLPRSLMGKALNYLRNHWRELNLYTTDGRLPIDNNACERALRQVATGRKNWLFFQSVQAGEEAAILLTLIQTANLNCLDARAYLEAVLNALAAGCTDYVSLCPHHWAQTHPEMIREYRREERRDALERRMSRRAQRRTHDPDP